MSQFTIPENESYAEFRERAFGKAYYVWHDGGPDSGHLATITDPKEREYVAQMLTRGVQEYHDGVAIQAWAHFDPEQGVQVLRPLVGQGDANFTSLLHEFLNKHDTEATEEERAHRDKAFGESLVASRGFGGLTALMSAAGVPTKEVAAELLERVANGGGYLERYHASKSLVQIAGVRNPDRYHKKHILLLIAPRTGENNRELETNEADRRRYQQAATRLRSLLKRKRVWKRTLPKV